MKRIKTFLFFIITLNTLIGSVPSLVHAWDPVGDLAHPERILRNFEREMRNCIDDTARMVLEPQVVAGGLSLAFWLQQSRDSALRGNTQPIPNNIRKKMKAFYDQDVLDRVKFKVGDAGVFNLANLSIQYGGAEAVTLVDVIVFKKAEYVNNATMWAHELKHIEQFRDWGTDKFGVRYVRSWRAVENEAYEAENAYKAWAESGFTRYSYTNVLPSSNNYYYVRSDISGLFLDVYGASKDVGGKIVQALPNSTQQWQLIPSETSGYFYIQSKVSGLFLDVYGASKDVGGKIVQAAKNPAQVWKLIPASKHGYYFIQSKVSELYLDVKAAAQTSGADIVQATRNDHQIWSFITTSE